MTVERTGRLIMKSIDIRAEEANGSTDSLWENHKMRNDFGDSPIFSARESSLDAIDRAEILKPRRRWFS